MWVYVLPKVKTLMGENKYISRWERLGKGASASMYKWERTKNSLFKKMLKKRKNKKYYINVAYSPGWQTHFSCVWAYAPDTLRTTRCFFISLSKLWKEGQEKHSMEIWQRRTPVHLSNWHIQPILVDSYLNIFRSVIGWSEDIVGKWSIDLSDETHLEFLIHKQVPWSWIPSRKIEWNS